MFFLADAYFHRLDPFAIKFPPSWPIAGIRWYGLSYAVGFLIAWGMVRWIARRGWSPLPLNKTGDFMFAVILGVLLGGRLGYAILYEPHLFGGFTSHFPFWDLLAINKGGMASHGGMIGVILACWWFGAKNNAPVLHIIDVGALAALPGLFLGRLANFINAELWGQPLPAAMQSYVPGEGVTGADPPWWSVKYPQEIIERWIPTVDPRLDLIEPLRAAIAAGNDFCHRAVEAARHGDAAVISAIKPLLTAYYPSQILQAITDGPILLGLLVLLWLRPRKPGVIGSWFLILYGLMRIATEVFRQPDAGVPLTFGLSRGQLLSLLMTLAGVLCLFIASRRDVPRLGGLSRRTPNLIR